VQSAQPSFQLIQDSFVHSQTAGRFQPWQRVWQCNDIGVTITARDPFSIEYDLGGSIWGGSRFTIFKGTLYFNGRPCLSQSVDY
jgi:hypothetical protein